MRLGSCGDGAVTRRRESGLQALGLAIEDALEERSTRAVTEPVPERMRTRAGGERASGL